MAILAGDIKLVASQVMDDVSEGGGAPTANIIQDGTSNSIFNDISELDRAGGRVNLRKVFASIQTNNVDGYFGGNVIVADPPDDPLVSVTIFKATNTFDRRTDARDRIESFLNKASLWEGFLLENHIAGQRSIQIFHREVVAAPVAGKTLYLVMNEGLENEYFQYVRVTSVVSEVRTFTYNQGGTPVDFTARVSTCSLSDALTSDFLGSPPSRYYEAATGKTKMRDTILADAATYYGAVKTAGAILLGDMTADVESVYTHLVPSAQTESGLVDKPLVGEVLPMVASWPTTVTRSVIATVQSNGKYVLPTGCYPGSLSLAVSTYTFTDDSVGNVLNGATVVGTIAYQTGQINFNASAPSVTGTVAEAYRPAAGVSMQTYTLNRPVTAESRSYVWVVPLTPIPSPTSLSVSYMVGGNWYELRDNGAGVLGGNDSSYGVGTVSYVTGTVNVTLGALPDIGSEILFAWGTPQEYVPMSNTTILVESPKLEFDLGGPVGAGTLVLTWLDGATPRTATDNGTGGITGDATGEITYGTGKGWVRTTVLPSSYSVSAAYDSADTAAQVYGSTSTDGTSWTATLPNAPIKPKSVVIDLLVLQETADPILSGQVAKGSRTIPSTIRDDGVGGLTLDGYGALSGSSINYTTGAVVVAINYLSNLPVPQYVTISIPSVIAGSGL